MNIVTMVLPVLPLILSARSVYERTSLVYPFLSFFSEYILATVNTRSIVIELRKATAGYKMRPPTRPT